MSRPLCHVSWRLSGEYPGRLGALYLCYDLQHLNPRWGGEVLACLLKHLVYAGHSRLHCLLQLPPAPRTSQGLHRSLAAVPAALPQWGSATVWSRSGRSAPRTEERSYGGYAYGSPPQQQDDIQH